MMLTREHATSRLRSLFTGALKASSTTGQGSDNVFTLTTPWGRSLKVYRYKRTTKCTPHWIVLWRGGNRGVELCQTLLSSESLCLMLCFLKLSAILSSKPLAYNPQHKWQAIIIVTVKQNNNNNKRITQISLYSYLVILICPEFRHDRSDNGGITETLHNLLLHKHYIKSSSTDSKIFN